MALKGFMFYVFVYVLSFFLLFMNKEYKLDIILHISFSYILVMSLLSDQKTSRLIRLLVCIQLDCLHRNSSIPVKKISYVYKRSIVVWCFGFHLLVFLIGDAKMLLSDQKPRNSTSDLEPNFSHMSFPVFYGTMVMTYAILQPIMLDPNQCCLLIED